MPTSPPIHRPKGYKPKESWGRDDGKTTTQRGYGWKWQKLRKQVIQRDNGLCKPCLDTGRVQPFTDIDHKIPKAKGGTDALDNLQCICKQCHQNKTATQDSK